MDEGKPDKNPAAALWPGILNAAASALDKLDAGKMATALVWDIKIPRTRQR
jgi:hypothetical protein